MDRVVMEYRPQAYAELEAAALAAIESGSKVLLDLDGLDSLDTVGVRGLISLLRRVRSADGMFVQALAHFARTQTARHFLARCGGF